MADKRDLSGRFSSMVRSADIWKILVLVFLLALIPRVLITITTPKMPSAHWDVVHDVVIARNIVRGQGFANEPGHPTAYRYPLHPMIMAVFFRVLGERYIPIMLFQSMLGALTAMIMAWIGYRAGGRSLALVTGVLVALNPELISFSRWMLSETVFGFLLTLAAFLFLRLYGTRKVWLSLTTGVVLGLAALCRPVVLVWVVLLAAILLWKAHREKGRLKVMLTLLIGFLVTVSPWLIRNQVVMGSPVFATSGGVTLWLFGHNDADRSDETTVIPDEFDLVRSKVKPRLFFTIPGRDPVDMVPVFNMEPRYQGYSYEQSVVDRIAGLGEVEADREFNSMAMEYIIANPLKTFAHSVRSAFSTLSYAEMDGRINIMLVLVMPFLLIGAYRLWRLSGTVASIVLSCLLSMLLVHFLFYFDHRFRVPYQQFMMLLGATGFLAVMKEGLSRTEKVLFYAWLPVPVIVNYFLVWGNQSG